MPRTTTLKIPGCPSVRLITGDELGFVKVVESNASQAVPQVVARWGDGDKRRSIVSMSVQADGSLFSTARKDNSVEVAELATGVVQAAFWAHDGVPSGNGSGSQRASDDGAAVSGVHLFRPSVEGHQAVLTCAEGGGVCIRQFQSAECGPENGAHGEAEAGPTVAIAQHWEAGKGNGSIGCAEVDGAESMLAVGGQGQDLNTWDIQTSKQLWAARSAKPDSLGLVPTPWVTSIAFVNPDDPRKIAVGTGHHLVRLYDTAAQRRPVLSVAFGDAPIRAMRACRDGTSVFLGNGAGNMASMDLRSGKVLGSFKGGSAGSIRCLARHPTLPLLASCGLDRFLRIHDTSSRRLLAKVFLKQHLVAVEFDVRENAIPPPLAKSDEEVAGINDRIGNDGEDVQPRIAKRRKKQKVEEDLVLHLQSD